MEKACGLPARRAAPPLFAFFALVGPTALATGASAGTFVFAYDGEGARRRAAAEPSRVRGTRHDNQTHGDVFRHEGVGVRRFAATMVLRIMAAVLFSGRRLAAGHDSGGASMTSPAVSAPHRLIAKKEEKNEIKTRRAATTRRGDRGVDSV